MGLYVAPLDPEIHKFKRQFTCSPCMLRIQTQSSGRITPVKMPLGTGDFPGGAVAKILRFQCGGARVGSLVRELDPVCHN